MHRCACALVGDDGIFDDKGVKHHSLGGTREAHGPSDVILQGVIMLSNCLLRQVDPLTCEQSALRTDW